MRTLRPDRLESATLLLLTAAIAYQLFVDPVVGMADNRDFARLMEPAGLDYTSTEAYRESVFRFIQTKFVFVNPSSHRYLTSERPMVGVAKLLNRVLSKDGSFDLQVLGFCHAVLYLGAVFIFLRAFRSKGRFVRLFVAGAVLLMCTDVRWVAYFNSFYCESTSLIFLFSTVGLALVCADHDRQGRTAWILWLAYMGSAFLFWMAKSQNTAFGPCLALGAWFFFPVSQHPVLRWVGAALIPVGIVWAFAVNAYGVSKKTNAEVVVAEEILPSSPNPVDDRRELGVDQGDLSLLRIARFYAHHPVRWWRMSQRQMKEAFGYLPLGNFTRASGLGPDTQSQAFNAWSEFKKAHYPKNLSLFGCLVLVYCVLAGWKAWGQDEGRTARLRTLVGPVLALGCVLEFIVTVTFEANGTAKHLFIFNVGVDLCLLMAVVGLADAAARRWRRRFQVHSQQQRPGEE